VAEGSLRLLSLPRAVEGRPCAVLCVGASQEGPGSEASGFCHPLLPGSPVLLGQDGACVTIPGEEGILGVTCAEAADVRQLAAELEACGCTVRRPPSANASAAASTARQAGDAVAGVIQLGAGALSWGMSQAKTAAQTSKLMAPSEKPLEVPDVVKREAGYAREGTKNVVMLTGLFVSELTAVAKSVAESAGDKVGGGGGPKGAVAQDAQHVGQAGLQAGLTVFAALQDAADQLVRHAADSSADLVGHKFGEEAGDTARDGLHAVGNVLEARGALCPKAVGKKVAVGGGAAFAQSALGGAQGDTSRCAPGGLCLGPAPGGAAMAVPAPPTPAVPSSGFILGPRPAA